MNILITGGAGFIGSNIAAHYLKSGHQITLFDNMSRQGVIHNLTWLKKDFVSQPLKIIKGDVINSDALTSVVKNQDLIFHFAGQTAVTTSIANPLHDFKVNAQGTFNLLEAVRTTNPHAIVCYSSTNKVYGSLPRLTPISRVNRYIGLESASIDESEPLDFYSPYGCSKGAGDQYMRDYARIYGLNTIIFRQSCIYGTHQFGVEDQGWVAHFAAQVIKNQPLSIFGTGKQVRDLLYISDLVTAFDKAVKKINHTSGQIYNIGGGISNSASLLEIIAMLSKISGKKITTIKKKSRQGDQPIFICNTDKAHRDFGWQPQVNLQTGIKLLYHWLDDFLAHNEF